MSSIVISPAAELTDRTIPTWPAGLLSCLYTTMAHALGVWPTLNPAALAFAYQFTALPPNCLSCFVALVYLNILYICFILY